MGRSHLRAHAQLHFDLDLDLDLDCYFAEPQKGQLAKGRTRALGVERRQPALEGGWRAGLCYCCRKAIPLGNCSEDCAVPQRRCFAARTGSAQIQLVEW